MIINAACVTTTCIRITVVPRLYLLERTYILYSVVTFVYMVTYISIDHDKTVAIYSDNSRGKIPNTNVSHSYYE